MTTWEWAAGGGEAGEEEAVKADVFPAPPPRRLLSFIMILLTSMQAMITSAQKLDL